MKHLSQMASLQFALILAFSCMVHSYPSIGNQQQQQQPVYGGEYYARPSRPNYYGNYYYSPSNYYWRPQYPAISGSGCAGNSQCYSACLQQPNWYNNWYMPPQQQEDNSTTARPPFNPHYGCQYSDCVIGGGYYGPSCGLRPTYNYGSSLCGSTGGWPTSYCGNEWNSYAYCDNNLCGNDCASYGQDGGYCDPEQNKCLCWKKLQNQEVLEPAKTSN